MTAFEFLAVFISIVVGLALVCRTPRRLALGGKVTAVPWQEIPELVEGLA